MQKRDRINPFYFMCPIDPVEPAETSPKPPMAPPYVDENLELEETERGVRAAEDERRDAVTQAYENEAMESEDPEEALDDISYPADDDSELSPEVRAMHEVEPPFEDLDR
jgi:hypothetical protein